VRLIAATNADLHRALTEGRLRRDLYYRLNVLPLHLPALRHRPDDIPLLARHFLEEHARALDRPCPALSAGAAEALRRREWPGNVRELSHLMERVLVMSGERGVIRPADVLPDPPQGSGASAGEPLSFKEVKRRVVERFERQYLHDVLRTHRGNITQAARASKKNRRAFWELMRKHGIDAARFRDR
jgi:DNA-binding NtrC family response regulator